MSGHNKWSKIKRKKGASDLQKAKAFTKISREIAVAVKAGGADLGNNARLRDIMVKARSANIPSDNVLRSIKKASGEVASIHYESIVYEGYGIGGVAVIVETLTDNKNRTAGEVRHIFDKYGGSLGATGCVSYMFETKGVIVIEREKIKAMDEFMLQCIDFGADDFVEDESECVIYTKPNALGQVRDGIEALGLSFVSAEVERVPSNTAAMSESQQERFETMLEKFEENDDVQNVYHNAE
ncbi:MAG: YebC/PmpR family DNA-binding transcriptional regulator [Firmicutes bacterium]|nr:YebC/PmpR family DNA-binding transcriptional regulator [Bacillota bacterium]